MCYGILIVAAANLVQSSLANAVSTLATHGKAITEIDVIGLAKKYEAFVLGQQEAEPSLENFADDIPF